MKNRCGIRTFVDNIYMAAVHSTNETINKFSKVKETL